MNIRPAETEDLSNILGLNNSAVPHVNRLTEDDLHYFLTVAECFLVAEFTNQISGFLILLSPGLTYNSDNYKFFNSRYDDFRYVDRIVIRDTERGNGIGKKLYKTIFEKFEDCIITCEVNIKPPNPISMSFHKKLEFREIDRQKTEEGTKEVALMMRGLTI